MTKYKRTRITLLALFGANNLMAQSAGSAAAQDLDQPPMPSDFVPDSQIVPVADEGIDEGDDYLVPAPTDEDLLTQEFQLYKALMADRVYDEADNVAKRVVELAIRIHGPNSNELARALTNLAIVQFETEELEASKQNFEAAIEIIEDNEDRLNLLLINPLRGLGAAQLESGRPDQASSTFRRAVHLTHVNEGPHNLDQVELLESIAETHLRMGDLETAKESQDTIYALNIRNYGLDTAELIPALMRRAAWQHRAGFVYDERTTYRRIVRIIENSRGDDAIELIEPLILLGKSFFFIDTSGATTYATSSLATGEIYFRRAVKIAEESEDATWQVTAQTTLALGDYYMFENNPQRARQVYKAAWNLLSQGDEQLDVRRVQLESIVALKQQSLPEFVDPHGSGDDVAAANSDDPLLQGNIAIEYSVSTRGRASDLKLISAEPEEFTNMLNVVQREVRRRIYRPRFQDGVAVDSPGLVLDHKFFYRQSNLDALRENADTAGDE